jgi:glycosyltransferase involved in cell wall biosynthesis
MIQKIKGWFYLRYEKIAFSYTLLRFNFFVSRFSSVNTHQKPIAVAIPHFNNASLIHLALHNVLCHRGVAEIVILDDGSSQQEFRFLKKRLQPFQKRIRLYRRSVNYGALATKIEVVSLCKQKWVLLLDCDNTYPSESVDYLLSINKSVDVIYCASFAFPHFDFTSLKNQLVNLEWMTNWIKSKDFNGAFLNDGNYLVPKENFVNVLKPYMNKDLKVSEVSFSNFLWLSNGFNLRIMDMIYLHRIHKKSISLQHLELSEDLTNKVRNLFESKRTEDIPYKELEKTEIERIY